MFTLLFNYDRVEAYELALSEGSVKYEHLAGGNLDYEGTIPTGRREPVQQFYHLDLSDARVGVQLPGLTGLPLFYPLGNLGGPFRYRVVEDDRIELLCQPYPKQYRAHFLKKYPDLGGPCLFDLDPIHYDPRKVKHVFNYGGVLGIASLSARERAKLKKDFLRFYREEIGVDLIAEDYDGDDTVTIEAIATGYTPFTQGTPEETCPNPDCEVHKAGTPLSVFMYLEPGKEDSFYEIIAGGDSGQLIWQLCRKCASVVVTNPCT